MPFAVSLLLGLLATGACAEYQGWATFFDAVGGTGGCGVAESAVLATDSIDYVALNVQDSPGDYYTYYSRPLVNHSSVMGVWNNGHNCGRWVRVTIGDYCSGVANAGAANAPFCNETHWVVDEYNNATLDLIVTDSCYDSNAWCRDDRYHLDIRTSSLARFKMPNGSLTYNLSTKWNNRRISWHFIEAPNYSGDIVIGLFGATKRETVNVVITHLPNGIHYAQMYNKNNSWVNMSMHTDDLGQVWGYQYDDWTKMETIRIRVYDKDDQLIFCGREYVVEIPETEVVPKWQRANWTAYGGCDYSSIPAKSSAPAVAQSSDPVVVVESSEPAVVVEESSEPTPVVAESSTPVDISAALLPSIVVGFSTLFSLW